MLTFASAAELAAAPVNNGVRLFISSCTDRKLLTKALELERAKGVPRLTRTQQLERRLEELAPASKAPKPKKDEPKVRPTVGPDDLVDEILEREGYAAKVLLGSIRSGSAPQIAVILRALFAGEYDVAKLATKLAKLGAEAVTTAKPAKPPRENGAPSDATMDMLKTLVSSAEHIDGEMVVSPAIMRAAGCPDSWFKYTAPWHHKRGTAGKGLLRLGYQTRTRQRDGGMHVLLVPHDGPVSDR